MLFCDHHYVAMETPVRKRAPGRRSVCSIIHYPNLGPSTATNEIWGFQADLNGLLYQWKGDLELCLSYTTGARGTLVHPNNVCKGKLKAQQKPGQKTTQNPQRNAARLPERDSKSLNHNCVCGSCLLWLGISGHANCQPPINHEGLFNLYKCSPRLPQIGHGNKVPENCNDRAWPWQLTWWQRLELFKWAC